MRLIYNSDWHLGKNFFEKKFFPFLKNTKADLLIITRDLVDKPVPHYETLKTLEEIFYQLFKLKLSTYTILGNNNSKRLSLYKDFLKFFNLFIENSLNHFFTPLEFNSSEKEKLYFYFFLYLSPFELKEWIKNFFQESFENFLNSKTQIFFQEMVFFLFFNLKLKKLACLLGHSHPKEFAYYTNLRKKN